MYPVLFTIGKVSIPTYTVLLDIGLILGLVVTYFEGKRAFNNAETALDLGLWTVIGGILGGRVGYVLAHWTLFSEDWSRVLRLWEGGLTFHGAFLGGLAVLAIFALLQRRRPEGVSFWEMGDVLVPGLALGLVFGWAACLAGGCAYGALGEGFGYLAMPDLFGSEAPRFATQIVGLAQAGVLFILFWLLRGRWPFSGAAFAMLCLLYFGGQFFLEFMRGDEAIYLGTLRMGHVLDLALVLAAAAGLLVQWLADRREGAEVEEPEAGEVLAGEGLGAGEEPVPGETATEELTGEEGAGAGGFAGSPTDEDLSRESP